MQERGSKIWRHTDTRDSALSIVDYLMNNTRPITMKVQQEIVDEKKALKETAAG